MIKIVWTEEKKNKAIEILTKYFAEHGSGPRMAAIETMCSIADDVLIDNEGIIYPDYLDED